MKIRFLPAADIDQTKWNSCVHYAPTGNIYGYKWYLNNTAKEWDGLVEDDYQSVMPLIGRKDKELYLPTLVREAGIYSVNVLSNKRINAFLNAIPEQYRRIRIALNEGSRPPKTEQFDTEERTNHVLLLNRPYEDIERGYSDAFRRRIDQATDLRLSPTSNLKPETIADFYRQHVRADRQLNERYHASLRIMYNVLHRGWGFVSGMLDEKKQLLSTNFFIYSHGRLLSFLPAVSSEGLEKGALEYQLDLLIRNNATRPLLLDLNTTDGFWPTGFAEQIGAMPVPQYQLVRKLPKAWWEKILS